MADSKGSPLERIVNSSPVKATQDFFAEPLRAKGSPNKWGDDARFVTGLSALGGAGAGMYAGASAASSYGLAGLIGGGLAGGLTGGLAAGLAAPVAYSLGKRAVTTGIDVTKWGYNAVKDTASWGHDKIKTGAEWAKNDGYGAAGMGLGAAGMYLAAASTGVGLIPALLYTVAGGLGGYVAGKGVEKVGTHAADVLSSTGKAIEKAPGVLKEATTAPVKGLYQSGKDMVGSLGDAFTGMLNYHSGNTPKRA